MEGLRLGLPGLLDGRPAGCVRSETLFSLWVVARREALGERSWTLMLDAGGDAGCWPAVARGRISDARGKGTACFQETCRVYMVGCRYLPAERTVKAARATLPDTLAWRWVAADLVRENACAVASICTPRTNIKISLSCGKQPRPRATYGLLRLFSTACL